FPDFVGGLAVKEFCEVNFAGGKLVGIESTLAENIAGAHDGILRVWAGLAFKAKSFFEIESDYGIFGELQHEVTQCADGNSSGDILSFVVAQFRMARIHFIFRR